MNQAKFDKSTHPKTLLNFDQVFKDVKILGAGGFGETHLVIDKSGKKYALKLLHPKGFEKMSYYREVSALINLSSVPDCDPNIVCYYNHFAINHFTNFKNQKINIKYYAILTEYIDGMTLAQFDSVYKLSVNDVIYVGLWLLNILDYLHKNGFAHNDISNANIMVTKDKQLKLIDLGLTCYSNTNSGYLRCIRERVVQLYYESPELHNGYYMKDVKKYSKTSDIYAAGVLLYELLTGKQPYRRNKKGDIISSYQNINNAPCINNAFKNMLLMNPDQRVTASKAHQLLRQCV